MLYKRSGLPEEEEIVLCKVTQILPNSVFVELLEYDDTGMVHISEIAPGRIRNLRDYVSPERQIVCKVLRVEHQTGHIDLSLRRVNSTERREKLEEIKQEQKAETLISNLAKKLEMPLQQLYQKVTQKVFPTYSHLYLCFKEVVSGGVDLEGLGLDKKITEELTAAIKEKFKPPKIVLAGEIKLVTYASEGLAKIKQTLREIQKVSSNLNLFYLGGGRYKLTLEDYSYKPAEKNLQQVQKILEKFNDKISTASFSRQ